DRARFRRRFRRCRDEDTATAADQKITGTGSEAVILDQRPVIRPNLEQPFGVRNHARTMATAERARARPQRIVFWPLRKPETHMNITAVTPAQMVHAVESRDWQRQCQRCDRRGRSGRLRAEAMRAIFRSSSAIDVESITCPRC